MNLNNQIITFSKEEKLSKQAQDEIFAILARDGARYVNIDWTSDERREKELEELHKEVLNR